MNILSFISAQTGTKPQSWAIYGKLNTAFVAKNKKKNLKVLGKLDGSDYVLTIKHIKKVKYCP